MENRMNRLVIGSVLLFLAPLLFAEDLPEPGELLKATGLSGQYVTVLEPHESDSSHQTHVTYLAVQANKVLDQLFGHEWRSADNDIVFSATDGYQFAANAERFLRYKAYLAYGRADAKPFALVNNKGQNTELGPYYLIWDNLDDPDVVKQGAYGWPYQVVRVDVRPVSAYAPMLPDGISRQAEEGFDIFKEYCLTCHQIAGIGGHKLPADLRTLVCSLKDAELDALIDRPGEAVQTAGMPPLDPQLQGEGRRQTIALIMAYLRALQPQGRPCQSGSMPAASGKE
jgi:mono/diheme cytochrome c family protein